MRALAIAVLGLAACRPQPAGPIAPPQDRPSVVAPQVLGLDRAQLWNLVNTGDPVDGPKPGERPADPYYRTWNIMPAYTPGEFEDHPLDLPTHGRFVTVYVNDIAYGYLVAYLAQVEEGGGEVPPASLPPGSIVLKENYPDDPEARPLQKAANPAVLTIAYKSSPDNCQSKSYFGDDQCLGGAWDWQFYGLDDPGRPRHHLDASVGSHTTSFCVNCHDPGVRTDYLRGLQRIVERKAASLRPTRDPAAPTAHPDPLGYDADPFCDRILLGSELPADVPRDPRSIDDPTQRQRMFDCFAWRSFAALSWPAAAGERGEPGPEPRLTDRPGADRVWETYKATWELFQPTDPSWDPTRTEAGQWSTPRRVPDVCPTGPTTKDLPVVAMVAKSSSSRDVANETGQAFAGSFGTLTDRNGRLVRYQVLFDRTEFEALVPTATTKLLTPAGPGAGVVDGRGVRLPEGSTEVKAAWKELCITDGCAQRDRADDYYARRVLVYSPAAGDDPATCEEKTFGLVGLHVARKTFWAPQWIWATFEHRLNAPMEDHANEGSVEYSFYARECTPPPLTPPASYPDCAVQPFLAPLLKGDPCCPNAELNRFAEGFPASRFPNRITRLSPVGPTALNAAYERALSGSVWANYFLVDTQWPLDGRRPAGDDGLRPVNTQLCESQWDVQEDPLQTVPMEKTDCYTMVPNALRNTSMESYMTTYVNGEAGPVHVSNRSCMGCHASGTDFSFVWLDGVEQVVDLTP